MKFFEFLARLRILQVDKPVPLTLRILLLFLIMFSSLSFPTIPTRRLMHVMFKITGFGLYMMGSRVKATEFVWDTMMLGTDTHADDDHEWAVGLIRAGIFMYHSSSVVNVHDHREQFERKTNVILVK
jgi:hypothetical protein